MSRISLFLTCHVSLVLAFALHSSAQIRDGGIDPYNLGKGDWIYFMSDATNRLGGNVASVTNENSLMLWYKSQGIRYCIVKAATSDFLFNGAYSSPQFNSNLVNIAHTNGILIFGYNRSYGSNVVGEVAITDYVFQQGADGFVWDAEAEWESNQPWIGTNGPALAWQLCSAVRSNWPTKFLAHAPFPIISYHTSFPYKEFGYWSDTIMPQIYHFGGSGLKGSPSAGIEWTDANWAAWQASLAGQSSIINGQRIFWTNAIKPHAPIQDVYGPRFSPAYPDEDVMEFIDYLSADPNCVTPGGYQGVSFWRTDLHGPGQWANIKAGSSGHFPGRVNNIVMDDARAFVSGAWTKVMTFHNGSFYGVGEDIDSFGTNYWYAPPGVGSNYVDFAPQIVTPGTYNVLQWHPYRANASAATPFVISHFNGDTTVLANQTTNSGNWSLLGQFYFDPGVPANVRISDAFSAPGKIALVDGLKLVFVPPISLPGAPIRPSASALSAFQVNLTWTDTATNETGFVVAMSTNVLGPFTAAWTAPANTRALVGDGLEPNTTYFFQVRATNFLGHSSWSSIASATTRPDTSFMGWGESGWNQLSAPASATNLIALAAGGYHLAAVRADGAVVAWGNNSEGQATVPATASNALAVAAGGYHTLALLANGRVIAWGANDYGQCNVPASATNVLAISAGLWHSLALRMDGTLLAWGDNSFGQCAIPSGLGPVTAFAGGGRHTLAVKLDGAVAAWGDNLNGQGQFAGQAIVPAGLQQVIAVAGGGSHSLALRRDGTVVAWGDNSQGQCQIPAGLSGVAQISAGAAHSLALKADGSLAAWGANGYGQCSAPAATNALVSAGSQFSAALAAARLPAPKLLLHRFQSHELWFLTQTYPRNRYALEYTPALGAPWTVVSTNSGTGGLLLWRDTAAGPVRLYRLRQY